MQLPSHQQPDHAASSGFLLTRQAFDRRGAIEVVLWLKTAAGPIQVRPAQQQALFFVEQAQAERVADVLAAQHIALAKMQALEMKTFGQQPVSACYFDSMQDFYRARDALKQRQIKCYEDDIRPDERFLMERFITASMTCAGIDSANAGYRMLTEAKCKALARTEVTMDATTELPQKTEQSDVTLSMLSIDVECSLDGELYSIAGYSDACQQVFMIGNAEPCAATPVCWVANEQQLLVAFLAWLAEVDPDVLIGWNVINFDLQLLQKRCDLYGIKFVLGRDGGVARWRQNKASGSEQLFIDIAGRVVLDGIDLLKTATYNFASFALENVAQALLGIGKKISDVDNRVAEITENFLHDKPALAAYNLEDCSLVWRIFEQAQLLDFAMLRAELTGLAIDRIGGSAAAFSNLYLPKLHRAGYIAPNLGDNQSDLVSPGGYVMDSIPGLYDNVLVLDFKSLYPSIIRTFCIDPMGLVEGLLSPEHSVPAFDGACFSRDRHFLPDIIKNLWQARDVAKQQQNAALSQAIKIIMNSFYGVLGSTGCRFFDPRLSGAITKRGHEILKTTKVWLEQQHQDYRVIYGDTDSIFVHIGAQHSEAECQQIGNELQQLINERWRAQLQQQYQLDSRLEIEFERHFSRFLMPTIRGLDVGTKKRYAGLVAKDGKQRIVFKGLESVRSDWTELAKEFQQQLYLKVFNHQPVADYVRNMVQRTRAGEFDDKLVYRKRLRRKLSHYVKNVPPHVKAARLADELNQQQGKALKYQNRGWIEYVMTLNGPQAKEHVQAALDYQFYIERQLAAVADAILPFVGTSFSQLTDQQLDLFS